MRSSLASGGAEPLRFGNATPVSDVNAVTVHATDTNTKRLSGTDAGSDTLSELSSDTSEPPHSESPVSRTDRSAFPEDSNRNFFLSGLNRKFNPLKQGGLGKEFWMKDASASECFACGRSFTTWRRRHHCRVCGQVFCSSCTTLIPGDKFQYPGKMRICTQCHQYLDIYDAESSGSSDDDTEREAEQQARKTENGGAARFTISLDSEPKPPPRMAIPATRTGAAVEIASTAAARADQDAASDPEDEQVMSLAALLHPTSPAPAAASFGTPRPRRLHKASAVRLSAAPALHLSPAAHGHLERLLAQFLADFGIAPVADWLPPLLRILTTAAGHIDLDVRGGDALDIRRYVQIKRIPGGTPGNSRYVDGVVCTGMLASRSMCASIPNPVILLITFPLEYDKAEPHFMSLEVVQKQETEYLRKLVGRIVVLQPSVVLVGGSAAGLAVGMLQQAGIAVVPNVKRQVLERLARHTGAEIVGSMDRLAAPRLGRCAQFEVKTFRLRAGRKSFLFFSGCPRHLGCTVVLRGADESVLADVKSILEFMMYVAFNLKLETSLLRDEGRVGPDEPEVQKPKAETEIAGSSERLKISEGSGDSEGSGGSGGSEVSRVAENPSGSTDKSNESDNNTADSTKNAEIAKSSAVITSGSEAVSTVAPAADGDGLFQPFSRLIQSKILSASPAVSFPEPFVLTRARALEAQLRELMADAERLKLGTPEQRQAGLARLGVAWPASELPQGDTDAQRIIETICAAQATELRLQLRSLQRQWEQFFAHAPHLLDPAAHQHLPFLYSLVSAVTATPCVGPENLEIHFYSESDTALGQFVEHACSAAEQPCSEGCGGLLRDHYRSYVHWQGRIDVVVEPFQPRLAGYHDAILMWSFCKVCRATMPVTQMSENTWKYSFGKYLELSFWMRGSHGHVGACRHDYFRDHVRYFGLRNWAVRFEYADVELLHLAVPRARVFWRAAADVEFRLRAHRDASELAARFFRSVRDRLGRVLVESVEAEKRGECGAKLAELKQRADAEEAEVAEMLAGIYAETAPTEYLPLNAVVRWLQGLGVAWDAEFLEFESRFFPSEKDITRITAAQLKKFFTEPLEPEEPEKMEKAGGTEKTGQSEKIGEGVHVEEPKISEKTKDTGEKTAIPEKPVESVDSEVPEKTEEIPQLKISDETEGKAEITESTESSSATPAESPAQLSLTPYTPPASPARSARQTDRSNRGSRVLEEVSRMEQLVEKERNARSVPTTPAKSRAHSTGSAAAPNISAGRTNAEWENSRELEMQLRQGQNNTGKVSELTSFFNKMQFDQLSMEFELERARERRKLHANGFRAVPVRTSRPIVEVFKNVEEAVEEGWDFDEERQKGQRKGGVGSEGGSETGDGAGAIVRRSGVGGAGGVAAGGVSRDGRTLRTRRPAFRRTTSIDSPDSTERAGSREEGEMSETARKARQGKTADLFGTTGDAGAARTVGTTGTSGAAEATLAGGASRPTEPSEPAEPTEPSEPQMAERMSLMKTLANFWADRSATGWKPLEYPLAPSEHMFVDSDVVIREDEPSSLIAFCVSCADYTEKLAAIKEKHRQQTPPDGTDELERMMLKKTGTHLRYQFEEGSAGLSCKIFFAEQFDALREYCHCTENYVQSLSRCVKWDSSGGKSGSAFLKTLDDRLVVKQLSHAEMDAFVKFAPSYFEYMAQAFFHELPTVIAKIFGFYRIQIKNPLTNKNFRMDVLVMENLFYNRQPTRIFDLKGSMRNRHVQQTGKENEVLLDENMVEYIYESPLFVREAAKKLLRASLWNDTLFLAKMNVMDYSLVIGIDEEKKELVVGIIDCIRTFTWDKKLESWVKERGLVGGGGKEPTVVTPRQYKNRFREAMERYILMVPGCWNQGV